MRPLFPYYGSKWREARKYPAPHSGIVVEPFAGSAGYATYWAPPRVHLYDLDPVLAGVWAYLIRASEAEVRALPDLDAGERVSDLPGLCQEARWLIGFWINRGSATPKDKRSAFSTRTERSQLVWSQRARDRIAADLRGVREWRVTAGPYTDAPRLDATYFVDPPYEAMGRHYRCGSAGIDFAALGAWCRALPGQVVACEQAGAAWLPFAPFMSTKATRGRSLEVLWHRAPDAGLAQASLFGAGA